MVTVFHCNGCNRALYNLQPQRGHKTHAVKFYCVEGSGGPLEKRQKVMGKVEGEGIERCHDGHGLAGVVQSESGRAQDGGWRGKNVN